MPESVSESSGNDALLSDNASIFEESSQVDEEYPFVTDFLDISYLAGRVAVLQKKYKEKAFEIKRNVIRQKQRLEPLKNHFNRETDRFKRKYNDSIDKLQDKWKSGRVVRFRDKVSFALGVGTIVLTALLVGMSPERLYILYTLLLFIFLPLRLFSYRKKGYQYFVADFCYWGNFFLAFYIWMFPNSERMFILCYAISYGTLAWSVVAWKNSLVFHSLDKITSLFIHFFPPLLLHCLVHLSSKEFLKQRFPSIVNLDHISIKSSFKLATISYAIWQIWYYFFIQVGKRDEIAAGKPTSFTWLKKAYANTGIGIAVSYLPESFHPFAFMLIQYLYSVITIAPCAIWFRSRLYSTLFITFIFSSSVWNGASYYVDVFGRKFQKELEALRQELLEDEKPTATASSPELSTNNE
ncbi:membrane transporter [Schizosaccharomyces japonicus yFS275]|uniref:Glycerophosphocholine acyltransferase 1 n=1 Tax=Schizosaccharomyces japonicus (strain yFS275 / FY16936) TaxID=402676 RepID=B6K3H0_SCHJY|nr:membrane transporter [Schizosaccharomyces japonicus yFS275]EEB08027.1 membrane transporter [Schizosaccharomyces japonicus yFS275]